MKKFVLCVFAAALTVLMLASCGAEGKVELRVYNWQDYMDPEAVSSPVSYPSDEILANGSSYAYLPEEISRSRRRKICFIAAATP